MMKKYGGDTYLFTANMRRGSTKGSFLVSDIPDSAVAEVIGENRRIDVVGGRFEDDFGPYDVHLYRIK